MEKDPDQPQEDATGKRIEQHLSAVKGSPDWADLAEILDWYKRDVGVLLAERRGLQERIKFTSDYETLRLKATALPVVGDTEPPVQDRFRALIQKWRLNADVLWPTRFEAPIGKGEEQAAAGERADVLRRCADELAALLAAFSPVADPARQLVVVNRDVVIRRAQARPCSHEQAKPCYACLADEAAEWMRRADDRASSPVADTDRDWLMLHSARTLAEAVLASKQNVGVNLTSIAHRLLSQLPPSAPSASAAADSQKDGK